MAYFDSKACIIRHYRWGDKYSNFERRGTGRDARYYGKKRSDGAFRRVKQKRAIQLLWFVHALSILKKNAENAHKFAVLRTNRTYECWNEQE